uniref:Ovule protein n=1 Tax=Ascaris lumbricoides TaxID=6252 RepID=A0A0M3I2F4_ASCLU
MLYVRFIFSLIYFLCSLYNQFIFMTTCSRTDLCVILETQFLLALCKWLFWSSSMVKSYH